MAVKSSHNELAEMEFPEALRSPVNWSDRIFMHTHVIPFIKYKRPSPNLWISLCKYAATVLFGINAPTPDLFFGVLGGFYHSEGHPLLSDQYFTENGVDFNVLEIDDIDMSNYDFGQFQSTTMNSMKLTLPKGRTVNVKLEELVNNTGPLFIALGLTVKWTGCGEFNNLQNGTSVIKTFEDMVEDWNDRIELHSRSGNELKQIAGKIITIYYLITARLVGKEPQTVYNTIVTTATAKCRAFSMAPSLLTGYILPPSKNAMKRLTVPYDNSVFIRPLAMAIASLGIEKNAFRKNVKRSLLWATCLLTLSQQGQGLIKWVLLAAERNDMPIGEFLSAVYFNRFFSSVNTFYDFMKVMNDQFSWQWANIFDPNSMKPVSTKSHLKFVFFVLLYVAKLTKSRPHSIHQP